MINKINIFGVEYKIEYVDGDIDMNGLCGRVYYDDQIIRIKKTLPDDTRRNTILHEILHVILLRSGLENILTDKDIDIEDFVDILANSLYNVVKSNDILED